MRGWRLAQCWSGSVSRPVCPSLSGSPPHGRLDMAIDLTESPASAAAGFIRQPVCARLAVLSRGHGDPGPLEPWAGLAQLKAPAQGTAEGARAVVSSDELGRPRDRNTKRASLSLLDGRSQAWWPHPTRGRALGEPRVPACPVGRERRCTARAARPAAPLRLHSRRCGFLSCEGPVPCALSGGSGGLCLRQEPR